MENLESQLFDIEQDLLDAEEQCNWGLVIEAIKKIQALQKS